MILIFLRPATVRMQFVCIMQFAIIKIFFSPQFNAKLKKRDLSLIFQNPLEYLYLHLQNEFMNVLIMTCINT